VEGKERKNGPGHAGVLLNGGSMNGIAAAAVPLRTLIGRIENFRVSRVAKSGGSRQYFPNYGKNRRRIFRGP
jgi:hypothetical protein